MYNRPLLWTQYFLEWISSFSLHYITTPSWLLFPVPPLPHGWASLAGKPESGTPARCPAAEALRCAACSAISHDAAGPRVVEDATCATYSEAPPALQTCNMQKCAEYRVARWSAVSEAPDWRWNCNKTTSAKKTDSKINELHLYLNTTMLHLLAYFT